MRVWTDGTTHLVLGPRGLTRHSKGKTETIPLGDAVAPAKGRLAWHARGVLAVDAKSQTAWVEWAGKLREVKLGGGPAKTLDWKPKDLVIREDGTAVAVLDAEKGNGKIVAGPVPADGKWKRTLTVPDPAKVKWPPGVVWAKGVTPPWSKKKEPGHDAYLSANAHGVALAERSSGIVAVMRPGKAELEFAVRVPTQDEADLTAAATPQGVLIVLCVEGRNSAAIHVDPKGKVLATLASVKTELEEEIAWGMGPPVLVGANKAFLVHEYTIPQVLDLALPGLGIESTWELPATSEGEKSAAASDDGKTCLLGFGSEVWMLTRTSSGWQLDELGEGAAGSAAPGARAPKEDEGGGPDIDIAAVLKAALGGGKAPAPGAAKKKASKAAKPALPREEEDALGREPEEEEEPGARKKKKKAKSEMAELDVENLGFGPLEEELEAEEAEAERIEERDLDDEDGEGEEEGEEGEEEEEKPARPAAAAPTPARRPSIEGDPALTLVAQAGGPKMWNGKPGASLSIDLGFGNVGGPSKGIFLEVEGGPIGAKKLVPKSVKVGALEVAFAEPKGNKARVEIKDLSLQAGAANEKAGQPPVPSQVLTVTLQFEAPQAADDLLLVRMGPLRVPRPGAGAFTHGKRLLIAP